jgi:hypothetical protein
MVISLKKIIYTLILIWMIGIFLFLLKPSYSNMVKEIEVEKKPYEQCKPCLNGELNEWNCKCKVYLSFNI